MNWSEFQRKQRVAEIGDSFLSYVDEGSGSPIVLLHGMPSWGYVWSSVLPMLTSRFRVLIPDLAGLVTPKAGLLRSLGEQTSNFN